MSARTARASGQAWSSTASTTSKGKLIGFAKITRDMTEQREAQQALLEAERGFRLLVQGVTDYAIYMLDPEGRVTNWNAGAQRIKGYTPDEIVGEHFSRFYTPEEIEAGVPKRALETAREKAATKPKAGGFARTALDSGRAWCIDAIKDDEGKLIGFAKITRDMTEKRENQLRLEEAASTCSGRRRWRRSASSPAASRTISTTSSPPSRRRRPRAAQPRRRGAAEANARRRSQLGAARGRDHRQLLAFARAQQLEIRTIDLRDFLNDVITLVRPSVRSNIELLIEVSDHVWHVDADPGALELALLNLAFNARDAMKDGGTLKISATNELLKGSPEALHGEFIALRVSDTGEGMTRDVMDRVFEPFFTTKSYGEGTGLGLSQVFGFAKQMGGAVTVELRAGEGATFTLFLPVTRGAIAGDNKGEGAGARGRVLVVEDDSLVAELAAGMLNELGFETVVTHSAREALARLSGDQRPTASFRTSSCPAGSAASSWRERCASDSPSCRCF